MSWLYIPTACFKVSNSFLFFANSLILPIIIDEFFLLVLPVGLHWSSSDSKSSQLLRSLLNIVTDLRFSKSPQLSYSDFNDNHQCWENLTTTTTIIIIIMIIIMPIRKSGICKTQNLFWRIRRTKFSGILRYKRITSSRPVDETL